MTRQMPAEQHRGTRWCWQLYPASGLASVAASASAPAPALQGRLALSGPAACPQVPAELSRGFRWGQHPGPAHAELGAVETFRSGALRGARATFAKSPRGAASRRRNNVLTPAGGARLCPASCLWPGAVAVFTLGAGDLGAVRGAATAGPRGAAPPGAVLASKDSKINDVHAGVRR